MIQTTQLSKKYGQAEVLNIESLEIPKGQSFGFPIIAAIIPAFF